VSRAAATADVFQAIASPTRRRILELLRGGERDVSSLCGEVDVSQPAVSQQLAVLKEAGLVEERREGRHRVYRLHARPLEEVAAWVGMYEAFWRSRLDALGAHLDAEAAREPTKKVTRRRNT
jgi:DNA-binding transcriptional ArsR family regulator